MLCHVMINVIQREYNARDKGLSIISNNVNKVINNKKKDIFLLPVSLRHKMIGMLELNFISSLINNKSRSDLSPVNDTTLSDVEGEMTKTMWTVAFSFIMVGSILGNSLVLWAVLGRTVMCHPPLYYPLLR